MNNRSNPNHPVVREMESQWHKLCAIALYKLGCHELKITSADLDAFTKSGLANITVHPKGDVITLRLVSDAEAERISKREGGLPV